MRKRNHRILKNKYVYMFLAPVLIIMILFFGLPLLDSIIYAFSDYKLTHAADISFNGLENFRNIFREKDLLYIAGNTFYYVFCTVSVQLVLGMCLALALRKPFKGRGIYQSIVFIPWAFSGFVIGLMFRWSFNGEYGVVNDLLLKTGVITKNINWLAAPDTGMFVSILAMIWMGVPFFGMMLLAALQSIPDDIFEAAAIDGCAGMRQFIYITVPFIKPTIVTTVLLRTIWVFNSFDLIMIITGFGPAGLTNTLASYMYNKAFTTYDFGMASAIGVLFMLGLGAYAVIFLKLTDNREKGE